MRWSAPARSESPARRAAGFTLVELIAVIAIVAIVYGLGVGRFAEVTPFRARAFAGELTQWIGAAQRMAVAQRREVFVRIDAPSGEVTLCLDAGCTQPVAAQPDGPARLAVPGGLRLPGAVQTFSFTPGGAPSAASPTQIDLLDAAGAVLGPGVSIEPGSGRVASR